MMGLWRQLLASSISGFISYTWSFRILTPKQKLPLLMAELHLSWIKRYVKHEWNYPILLLSRHVSAIKEWRNLHDSLQTWVEYEDQLLRWFCGFGIPKAGPTLADIILQKIQVLFGGGLGCLGIKTLPNLWYNKTWLLKQGNLPSFDWDIFVFKPFLVGELLGCHGVLCWKHRMICQVLTVWIPLPCSLDDKVRFL